MLEPYHERPVHADQNEGALVNAVRANPADNTPKLVLADYLDDTSRPATAAMYRAAVAGAGRYRGPTPTTADAVAMTRHAGVLSGLVTPTPRDQSQVFSLRHIVDNAANAAQAADELGPQYHELSGRTRHRHMTVARYHMFAAQHHDSERSLANDQAAAAHRFAASVHRRLASGV